MHDGHRDRLRERYANHGYSSLQEHEFLELLLFYCIPRKNTNDLAHILLDRFGSLSGVLEASYDELLAVKGVGEATARFMGVLKDLSRRLVQGRLARRPLSTLGAMSSFAHSLLSGYPDEQFFVLLLDARYQLIATEQIAVGIPDQVTVYPRQVAQAALRAGATSVVLAHNHPSGGTSPSSADVQTTGDIKAALSVLDVKLVEHFIVGGNDVYGIISRCKIDRQPPEEAEAQVYQLSARQMKRAADTPGHEDPYQSAEVHRALDKPRKTAKAKEPSDFEKDD